MRRKRSIAFIFFSAAILIAGSAAGSAEPVTLKVGHVGHDHHTALFVAADNAEKFAKETGVSLKTVKDKQFYDLCDGAEKIAAVEFVQVGDGAKMPTALAQGVIEIGLGGIAPVLAAADKGAPVKLVEPDAGRVDLPRPRDRLSEGFTDLFIRVRRLLSSRET